jgi:hypothetical protein
MSLIREICIGFPEGFNILKMNNIAKYGIVDKKTKL